MVLRDRRQRLRLLNFFVIDIKCVNLLSLPGIKFSIGVSRPNESMTMGSLCWHTALMSHGLS